MEKRIKILRWASLLALVGVFCLSRPGFCADAQVKFSLILEKAEFSADESINVAFSLKNLSQSPIMVNQRFYISGAQAPGNQKEVYFNLTSPSGARLTCQNFYETGYPKTDYFKSLAPGEEVKSEHPRNLKGFYELTEPGTYILEAVYQNVFGQEIGLDTYQEQLVSAPVKFTILNSKK